MKTLKNVWQKIVTTILAVVLCIECTDWSMLTVFAEDQIYVGDFNLYTYRADKYLEDDTVCNRIIQNMMTATFPSQIIVNGLNEDSSFRNAVDSWKAIHYAKSPSEYAEGKIDEKGYYEAMILSVFVSEATSEHYAFDVGKKVSSDTNKVLSNMKKWVKESDQLELDKLSKNQSISSITNEEKETIKTYLAGEFENIHPVLATSSSIADIVSTCFDSVETVGEAVELMAYYTCICDLSIEVKAVLTDMYEKCPSDNETLKSALQDIISSMDSFNSGMLTVVRNVAIKESVDVAG